MVGGLLVSAGMMLASFGTSIMHLYLCIGIISGENASMLERIYSVFHEQ